MALFGRKKNTEEKKETSDKKEVAVVNTNKKSVKVFTKDLTWVLKGPRITEKGAIVAEFSNSYTFNIDQRATKTDVKQAIESIYKVIPTKVTIAKIPAKKVQIRGQRGKRGIKSGGKKAFIFLKKGDKIEFV